MYYYYFSLHNLFIQSMAMETRMMQFHENLCKFKNTEEKSLKNYVGSYEKTVISQPARMHYAYNNFKHENQSYLVIKHKFLKQGRDSYFYHVRRSNLL
jgi:hypothetical protein